MLSAGWGLGALLVLAQAGPSEAERARLHEARKAAALGGLEDARRLLEDVRPEAPHMAEAAGDGALLDYRELLDEVRRQEALILHAYAAGGGLVATQGLLEAFKGSAALKDSPELVAHAVRLERALGELDTRRARLRDALAGGRFEEALAQQRALLAQPLLPRIPGLRQELLDLGPELEEKAGWAHQARLLLAQWGREVAGPPLKLLGQAGVVLLLFLPLRALWKVAQAWRLKKRKHSTLRVVDLSEGATPAASQMHAVRLKTAFEELGLQRVRRRAGAPEAEVGEALPQWEAPELRELEELSRHFSDDKLVVGPVSLPLRSLLGLMGQALFPSRYVFECVVDSTGGRVRVTLGQRDNKTGDQVAAWREEASGERALDTALRRLALKVALHEMSPEARPTEDADAFVAFREAVLALGEASSDTQRLNGARELLWRVLALDPLMAEARLMLAIVLRKLNEQDSARALLEELIGDERVRGELHRKARYNLALLHAHSGRVDTQLQAREEFSQLARGEGELALDARACLLDVCVNLLTSPSSRERLQPALREQLEESVRQQGDFFLAGKVPPESSAPLRTAFIHARAYASYALGKWHIERGGMDEGVRLLQRALVHIPELLGAQLAIARAHRKLKRPFWEQDAQRALDQAVKLNPHDARVNMEYARFMLSKGLPDAKAAASYYERAASQRGSARVEWGRLLVDLGEPEQGVARMWEGIQMAGEHAPAYFAEALLSGAAKGASALREKDSQGPGAPGADPAAGLLAQVRQLREWMDAQRSRLERRADSEPAQVERLLTELERARERCADELTRLSAWPPAPAPSPA